MLHQLMWISEAKVLQELMGVSFVEFNSIHELSLRSSRYLAQSCRLHCQETLGETLLEQCVFMLNAAFPAKWSTQPLDGGRSVSFKEHSLRDIIKERNCSYEVSYIFTILKQIGTCWQMLVTHPNMASRVTTVDLSTINSSMNALSDVNCYPKWSQQPMGKRRIWIRNWRKCGQQIGPDNTKCTQNLKA